MKTQTFNDLIRQINQTAGQVQRERGNLFEKLVLAYLKNEPTYKRLYKNVWLLHNVPAKYGIPKKDTGVDLVAEQFNGDLVAVQAKFYKGKVGKAQIDSFVAELGKKYYKHGLIISTVDDWNRNARETIDNNDKGIGIIGLSDLRYSQIDWSKFSFERPEQVTVKRPKQLRDYQIEAVKRAVQHFAKHDRGQLIMAPGTGKTFTSLKIAESLAKNSSHQFKVLYLVPSIQLLTQTLRSWNNDCLLSMTKPIAVTSDRDASRGENGSEDIKAADIGYPATTSTPQLLKDWYDIKMKSQSDDLMVVFSTYQSIDVIGNAQKSGFPEFDFIIADEAHRTANAHKANKEASVFSKVHSNAYIKGLRRMYQTATPKIYGEPAQKTAKEKSVLLFSMDDTSEYGEVFFKMGFGQAVSRGILTDYKVMVLAVDEAAIQKDMQQTLSDPENGLNIDDIGRIVGIWNGMMRRNGYKNPVKNSPYDGAPLERAIAFTRTIEDSKKVSQQFERVVNEYIGGSIDNQPVHLSMRHADGSMNALQKGDILDWLADSDKPDNEARIVSNVRFLTEGVDVPTLDAVIFLAPKRSRVDIVQAIGRIMRKAKGKDYGYIILPIVVPTGETPETILDNNKKYDVVWEVINALRTVDERFEAKLAMTDKINITKDKQLKIIGVGSAPEKANNLDSIGDKSNPAPKQTDLDLEWDKYKDAIYGKIVQKVGDRKYLEDWSKDVAKIAQRQISWIKTRLTKKKDPIRVEFQKFVISLQHNINDGIDENQAAEMLSQHLITRPIFEALFDKYSFVHHNPVSLAMENIVHELEKAGFAKEQESLEPLYESVRMRAEGIEKATDKQKIIITLYEKFFKTAFKSTTDRLGIVFTPIEVVDFIVHSVDDVLKKHFDKSLASKNVHILDPFTGTGTFIVRTLTYLKAQMDAGEISLADITRKFTQELHANEIVLLSYYIAAINIEATFDEINGEEEGYVPFEGIVLTDTFESTETEDTLDDDYFGTNDERLKYQQKLPITAIIGNPPYSKIKSTANDFTGVQNYPKLDDSIKNTYAKETDATLKNSLQDSYIRALRWSTDRLAENGVIGFITNNGYIDSPSLNGVRRVLQQEFNYIYIIDLKGAVRGLSPEAVKRQGKNIFDIMTGVAIVLLIKDGSNRHEIRYHDIGDNQSKNEKLDILARHTLNDIEFKYIVMDENGDWINQRDKRYDEYISLNDSSEGIFINKLVGFNTNRDFWAFNFSRKSVTDNIERMISNYSSEIIRLANIIDGEKRLSKLNSSEDYISWSRGLKNKFIKSEKITMNKEAIMLTQAKPFTKKYVYYDRSLVEMPGKFDKLLEPNGLLLYTPGPGGSKTFSALIARGPVNLQGFGFASKTQTYPFKIKSTGFISKNNYNLTSNSKNYFKLGDEELIYYVYAVLNSNEYKSKYEDELYKTIPRIPLLKYKEKYVEIGRKLADIHLNYEDQPRWEGVEVEIDENNYHVTKMKHPKKGVLDTIIYNESITIKNIPEKAYEYVVNGRPAIDWIIDQYQVKTDKKSGITDDPNEFSDNPKYILNLLLSVITVSMRTLELIDELPEFEIQE